MEFIGVDPGAAGRIPVPNLTLSPETLCKNYPLELLMQPIIPLLSVPTTDSPSFYLSIPWFKEACLAVSNLVQTPQAKVLAVSIVTSGAAYYIWKLSLKWNDGIFDKNSDPETEILDAEVARIMSTIIEEGTISPTCTSSIITDRFSQETLCSCATEVGRPLKRLQSRVDQVMSKVDVVLSSLRLLEDTMSPRKGNENSEDGLSRDALASENKQVPSMIEEAQHQFRYLQYLLHGQSPEKQQCHLTNIHQRIKDLEHKVESIKSNAKESKDYTFDSAVSPGCFSDHWEKSSSVSIISEDMASSSPLKNCLSLMSPGSPHIETMTSPSAPRTPGSSPQKQLKRTLRSRRYNFTQFPPIEEDSLSHVENGDATETDMNKEAKDLNHIIKTAATSTTTATTTTTTSTTATHEIPSGDSCDNVEYADNGETIAVVKHKPRCAGLYRQGTWPSVYSKQTNKSSFWHPNDISRPSEFKQSENSSFEAIHPQKNAAESCCLKTGTKENIPVSAKQNQRYKSPNLARCEFHHRKDNANKCQSRPNDYRSKDANNIDVNFDPQLISSRAEDVDGVAAITELSKKGTSNHHDEHDIKQPPNNQIQTCSLSTSKKIEKDTKDLEFQTHGHQQMSHLENRDIVPPSPHNVKEESNKSEQIAPRVNHVPSGSSQHASERSIRRLSPFKRLSRKTSNDYQVKYINNKGSEEKVAAASRGEKEDEWIVIVPSKK